jgi:hypothetical protein
MNRGATAGVDVVSVGTLLRCKTEIRDLVGRRLAVPGDCLRIVSTESAFYRYYVVNTRTAEPFGIDGGEVDMTPVEVLS